MLALTATAMLGGCALLVPVRSTVGWSPEPTEPDPAFVKAAPLHCLEATAMDRLVADREPLFDQRGQGGAGVLWSDPDGNVYCFLRRSPEGGWVDAAFSRFSAHDGITEPYQEMPRRGNPVAWIIGPAHPDAASALVLTRNDLEMVASISDGSFTAWWPDDDPAVSVSFFGPGGDLIETVPVDAPVDPTA